MRYNGDIECIISHTVPLNLILVYIFLLVTVFLFVYTSYTIILIKFCKRKRRLQRVLIRHQEDQQDFCIKDQDELPLWQEKQFGMY